MNWNIFKKGSILYTGIRKVMRILFVCTGNSCRSPMAELYFNSEVQKRNISNLEALSAGVAAFSGDTISVNAASVMAENAIVSDGFRSRRFTPLLADECDLIVCMGESHRRAVLAEYPECKDKICLLMDLISGGDVPDPFGGDVDRYRKVFAEMRPALDALIERVS